MAIKQFELDFDGLAVHCYEGGRGFPILMLHGSGAGTSSASNWARVLDELAAHYHVFAADLIGFGRSARKPSPPYFDIALWTRQAQFLFDRISNGANAGFIGHSLSGFLGLRLAAARPNLVKLLVTGCPGTRFMITPELQIAWTAPRSLEELRRMYESVVADASGLTEEFYRERLATLNEGDYADYFSSMFTGDKQAYLDQLVLSAADSAWITSETLFVHGLNDRMVPFAEATLPLLRSIATADAVLIKRCGHGPALEQPTKFVRAAHGLFGA